MDQSKRIRLRRTSNRPRIHFKICPVLNSGVVDWLYKFTWSLLVLFWDKFFICLAVLVAALIGWGIVGLGVSGSEIANWALVALADTLDQRTLLPLWHLVSLGCLLVLHDWRAGLLLDLLIRYVAHPVAWASGKILGSEAETGRRRRSFNLTDSRCILLRHFLEVDFGQDFRRSSFVEWAVRRYHYCRFWWSLGGDHLNLIYWCLLLPTTTIALMKRMDQLH